MRGTVAKRIRREARRVAATMPTKVHVLSTIKKYVTGKVDEKGDRIVTEVDKTTIRYSGYRRVYQDMKQAYMKR